MRKRSIVSLGFRTVFVLALGVALVQMLSVSPDAGAKTRPPRPPKVTGWYFGYNNLRGCVILNDGVPRAGNCFNFNGSFGLPAGTTGSSVQATLLDGNGLNLATNPGLTVSAKVTGRGDARRIFFKLRRSKFGFCKPASGDPSIGAPCLRGPDCGAGQVCEGMVPLAPLSLTFTVDGVAVPIPLSCRTVGDGDLRCKS